MTRLVAQNACSMDSAFQEEVNNGLLTYELSVKPFPEHVENARSDEYTLLQDQNGQGLISESAMIKKTLKLRDFFPQGTLVSPYYIA